MDDLFPPTQRCAAEPELELAEDQERANGAIAQQLQRLVIGTFRVKLSSMELHPENRELSEEHMQRLVHTLRESDQMYFNQMLVCVHTNIARQLK